MSYGLYNNEFAQINHQYTWMEVAAAPAFPTDGLIGRWQFENDLTDSYNDYDLTGNEKYFKVEIPGFIGEKIEI